MAQDCRRQHVANPVTMRSPAQRNQDCLMLEEDCSSSFLPSKILGADEAAVFVVAVVVILMKRYSFDNMMLIPWAQAR
ncbi:unnamed protein product [Ectocarpus sp. 12 AP-2014]